MNWFYKLRLRWRALFQKEKLDTQMDDEMRSHIEMRMQQNIEAGMLPREARDAAMRRFGPVESIKERCREQRGVSWIENLMPLLVLNVADLTICVGHGGKMPLLMALENLFSPSTTKMPPRWG